MKIKHLRTKLFLTGVPILLLGSLGFYAASSLLLLPGFQKIEDEAAISDASRAVDALSNRINQLDQKSSDWSNWDDAYEFISDHNKKFINANLGNESIANLGIEYMLFYDANHRLVEGRHVQIDDPELRSRPLDAGMTALLSPDSPLLRHANTEDAHKGVVRIPEGLVMLVSRPILNSQSEGPVRGSLIFAQFLGTAAQKELSELTHLELTYLPANNEVVTKSVPAFSTEGAEGTKWVGRISNMRAQAFAIIPDIYGERSLAVKAELNRTISQYGRSSLNTFMLAALFVALAMIIMTALLLNSFIVTRIIGLSRQLSDIKDVQDSTKKVAVSGSDELTDLGAAINGLLARLHKTYDLEQANTTLEQQVRERTKELVDQLAQTKRINDLMIDRELRMKELKEQNANLRSKSGDNLT